MLQAVILSRSNLTEQLSILTKKFALYASVIDIEKQRITNQC